MHGDVRHLYPANAAQYIRGQLNRDHTLAGEFALMQSPTAVPARGFLAPGAVKIVLFVVPSRWACIHRATFFC
jgi:hypothetical protein